jgi:hypothetical protein
VIDWAGVAVNTAWVLGLAVLLATLSYADWARHCEGARWRDVLGRTTYRSLLNGGMVLVCLGLLGGGRGLLEKVLWGLMAAWFAGDVALAWLVGLRRKRSAERRRMRGAAGGDDGH